jgi:hypothetical protein
MVPCLSTVLCCKPQLVGLVALLCTTTFFSPLFGGLECVRHGSACSYFQVQVQVVGGSRYYYCSHLEVTARTSEPLETKQYTLEDT